MIYIQYTNDIYMEFRKMVMITLYVRQQKRHRCIEQSFGLWERGPDKGFSQGENQTQQW